MEAAPGFEPGMKDLQSSALPLGYAAVPGILGRMPFACQAGLLGARLPRRREPCAQTMFWC